MPAYRVWQAFPPVFTVKGQGNNVLTQTRLWLVFQEHCVFCNWITVKCHKFVSNLIIVKNCWTRDTSPLIERQHVTPRSIYQILVHVRSIRLLYDSEYVTVLGIRKHSNLPQSPLISIIQKITPLHLLTHWFPLNPKFVCGSRDSAHKNPCCWRRQVVMAAPNGTPISKLRM